MTAREFASRLVDACAASKVVIDYDLQIHENAVVKARLQLARGFVDVYRNFETGRVVRLDRGRDPHVRG